jgi:hypothetical protein
VQLVCRLGHDAVVGIEKFLEHDLRRHVAFRRTRKGDAPDLRVARLRNEVGDKPSQLLERSREGEWWLLSWRVGIIGCLLTRQPPLRPATPAGGLAPRPSKRLESFQFVRTGSSGVSAFGAVLVLGTSTAVVSATPVVLASGSAIALRPQISSGYANRD